MAYDFKDEDGQLDRGKVLSLLDGILEQKPALVTVSQRQQIVNLIDEAVEQAFMDGMEFLWASTARRLRKSRHPTVGSSNWTAG